MRRAAARHAGAMLRMSYTDGVNLVRSALRFVVFASIASLACEPAEPARHAKKRAPGREAVLSSPANKAEYDRGRALLGSLDALRGSAMTEALATDLGFKCANLRASAKALMEERDPLVWQFRSDVDRTCGLDVPLACALFDVDRIEKKRAGQAGASVKGECLGLRLAIGDFGSAYLDNPDVVAVAGKLATYCGPSDASETRVVP